MRRDRFDVLSRPWFAGGTITIASVGGDSHYLRRDEGAFEDGTVDYLNLPAVTIGLRYLNRVGLDSIHRRVGCLTGWLLDALDGLRHTNGRRLVEIYGPRTVRDRGGTVTLAFTSLSDMADYVNGVLLPVDGGFTAKLSIPDTSALSAIGES